MSLMIDQIRLDGGTQSRAAINAETVAEYAEQMEDETTVFPPVIVYHDGKDYWLADGFHRVEAWKRIGMLEVPAEVRQGDRRAAILHSCQANSAHGLRRSDEDKRRAVVTLLEDAEWSQWSDREIARRVRVSPTTVAKYRAELSVHGGQIATERKVERGGTVYTQDTAKIGKPPASADWMGGPGTGPKPEPTVEENDEPHDPVHAEKLDAPAPPVPDPYGYAKLTEEALLDLANGLRASLDEEKAKRKKAEAERDDFKAKWQEALAQDDMGRALGNAQRQRDTAKGRLDEELAKNARQGRRITILEAELKKLREQVEGQEFTL